MLSIFNKKRQEPGDNKVADRIANVIVRKFIYLQKRWVAFMHRLTNKLSKRSKKWAIILFSLLAGGCCLYTITNSFSSTRKKPFQIFQIEIPENTFQDGEERRNALTIIPENEYRKIHRFRKYMDSLSHSDQGKLIADSILLTRQGLMDSIIQIEQIYHSQQSTKK